MDKKNQKVAVAGLLVVDRKALVVRRSSKESFLPGYYEIPGGKLDFGEEPSEGIIREFKEETNLQITPKIPYRVFTYISQNGERQTVEIVYLVELQDTVENLKLSDAHDDYQWLGPGDVDNLDLSDEIKADLKEGFALLIK